MMISTTATTMMTTARTTIVFDATTNHDNAGSMAQQYNGTMASLMVQWYDVMSHNGTWLDGTMTRWHKGSLVLCDGTMVHGLMGRWLDGTMAQCIDGRFNGMMA